MSVKRDGKTRRCNGAVRLKLLIDEWPHCGRYSGSLQRAHRHSKSLVVPGTYRSGSVPVAVEVLDRCPDNDDLADWDHLAEASIHTPNGVLVIRRADCGHARVMVGAVAWMCPSAVPLTVTIAVDSGGVARLCGRRPGACSGDAGKFRAGRWTVSGGVIMHLVPPHLQHLDEEHGLGRPEAVYAQRAPRVFFLTAACILMLLAMGAGLAGFLYPTPGSALPTLAYSGQDVTGSLVVAALLFLVGVGAGGLSMLFHHKAYVFADGFVVTRGGRVDVIIRWDEIESLSLGNRYSFGSVWYRDRSGTPRTYSFWSFAGKLKRRCAAEMQLRGKDAPWIPPNWAVAVLLVGIVLPWAAMGGGIAVFGQGVIAGLLTLIGSAPFIVMFVYLLRGQWAPTQRRQTGQPVQAAGRTRQVDKPVADEKMGPAETVMTYGCAILLLGFLAWLEVVFPVLIAFGVNLDATHAHSHR